MTIVRLDLEEQLRELRPMIKALMPRCGSRFDLESPWRLVRTELALLDHRIRTALGAHARRVSDAELAELATTVRARLAELDAMLPDRAATANDTEERVTQPAHHRGLGRGNRE